MIAGRHVLLLHPFLAQMPKTCSSLCDEHVVSLYVMQPSRALPLTYNPHIGAQIFAYSGDVIGMHGFVTSQITAHQLMSVQVMQCNLIRLLKHLTQFGVC